MILFRLSKLILGLSLSVFPIISHAVGACDPGEIETPASFSGVIEPATARDLNPDPDILEVYLTARPATWDFGLGNEVDVWTYNGVIPGPTLQAKVGDTLIVNFCNGLPDESTIHWHGLETPANMDGSNISQGTVPPGGTFRYEIPLFHSGTFWYHPHFQTHRQVEKGLYGVLVVRDPDQDKALGIPEKEHIMVLDDVLIDENNQITEPFLGDKKAIALEKLNGREGNVLLVNGVSQPQMTFSRSEPHRIRMVNAANSRFMRTTLQIHDFIRIGGDQGLLEEAQVLSSIPSNNTVNQNDAVNRHLTIIPDNGVLLTPGERADIVFNPLPYDATFELRWHDTVRGRHDVEFLPDGTIDLTHGIRDGDNPNKIFGTVQFTGAELKTPFVAPSPLRIIPRIDVTDAPTLPLVMGHTLPDWDTGDVKFFVQAMGMPFPMLTPDDVHTVVANRTYVWEVKNLTEGRHNFHTHGFRFQHIETEYKDLDFPDDPALNFTEPAAFIEDKDTIMLEPRPGLIRGRSFSLTRLAVNFSDSGREKQIDAFGKMPEGDESGGWLAHCHILEHSASGMMTFFQVDDPFRNGFD
ncbi:multicopper oxidase family protein [Marinicella marina]|uniref:multicopper oxidase family protein n=1 Tax=Marinicella marina TaxID=2996016 RepID=UPI002260BAA5|nr:multicopper oxidase family protein [Marinicella marina]